MNFEYRQLLKNDMHPASRVWVYQSSRIFSLSEALAVEEILQNFQSQWNSHGAPVKSDVHLLFGQFIVLIADETATTVGGCSTDSSVRVMKEIEQRFGVNLFDRHALAFLIRDKVELIPFSQLSYAIQNGFIKADTLYFNNLVQTKRELEENWIIPAGQSWLAKKADFAVSPVN